MSRFGSLLTLPKKDHLESEVDEGEGEEEEEEEEEPITLQNEVPLCSVNINESEIENQGNDELSVSSTSLSSSSSSSSLSLFSSEHEEEEEEEEEDYYKSKKNQQIPDLYIKETKENRNIHHPIGHFKLKQQQQKQVHIDTDNVNVKPDLQPYAKTILNQNDSSRLVRIRDKLSRVKGSKEDRNFIYSQGNKNINHIESISATENKEEMDRRMRIAVILIQDAIYYRNPNHLLEERSLKIYKIYFNLLVRTILFILVLGDMILAFFEYPSRHLAPKYVTLYIELGIVIVLSFELGVRFYIYGKQAKRIYWNYVKGLFLFLNYIDLLVAFILEANDINPVRISRILRIYYLMDYDRLTRDITIQVSYTLFRMIPIGIIFFTYIFLSSILFSIIFSNGGTSEKDYYDSTLVSFLSNMVMITTANFPDIMLPAYYTSHWYGILFVLYLVIGLYLGIGFIIALVYQIFRKSVLHETKENFRTRRTALLGAFILLDYDKSGLICMEQWQTLYKLILPKSTTHEADVAFELIDTDSNGLLNISEFFAMCDIFVTGKIHIKKAAQKKLIKELKKIKMNHHLHHGNNNNNVDKDTHHHHHHHQHHQNHQTDPTFMDKNEISIDIRGSNSIKSSPTLEIPNVEVEETTISPPPTDNEGSVSEIKSKSFQQLPTIPRDINEGEQHSPPTAQRDQNNINSIPLNVLNQNTVENNNDSQLEKSKFHKYFEILKSKFKHLTTEHNLRFFVNNWIFETVVSIFIYLNAVDITLVMVTYRNLYNPEWTMILDDFLLGIAITETLLKVYAYRCKFRKNYWILFNLIIVGVSLIGKIVFEWSLKPITNSHIDLLRVACAFRFVRVFRLLSSTRTMRHFIKSIIQLILIFLNFFGIIMVVYYFFGVIGLWAYNGKFYRGNPALVGTLYDTGNYYGFASFDDLSSMYITLFHLMIVNNWLVTFFAAIAVTDAWSILYFCLFYFIMVICILNMIIAFLIEAVNYTNSFYYNKKRKYAKKKLPSPRTYVNSKIREHKEHQQNVQLNNDGYNDVNNNRLSPIPGSNLIEELLPSRLERKPFSMTSFQPVKEKIGNSYTDSHLPNRGDGTTFHQKRVERPQDYLIRQLERIKANNESLDDHHNNNNNNNEINSTNYSENNSPSNLRKSNKQTRSTNQTDNTHTVLSLTDNTSIVDEKESINDTTHETMSNSSGIIHKELKKPVGSTLESNFYETQLFNKELSTLNQEDIDLDPFMEDNIQSVFENSDQKK